MTIITIYRISLLKLILQYATIMIEKYHDDIEISDPALQTQHPKNYN